MQISEVESLFISAAFADRDIAISVGSRAARQRLPFLHEERDVAGWSLADRIAAKKTFDPEASRRSREAMDLWERANELTRMVECEKARRSLWGWSKAKAGGKHFKKWCAEEGVSVETGRRRKDRAVSIISARLTRKTVEPECPAACAVSELMPEVTAKPEDCPVLSWQDDDATTAKLVVVAKWRGWREERNAERRKKSKAHAIPLIRG